MAIKQTIKFVTGNKNKVKEVSAFLKGNELIEILNISLDRMKIVFYFSFDIYSITQNL